MVELQSETGPQLTCVHADTEGGHSGLGSEERKGDSSTVPVPAAHLSPQLG